MKRRGRPLIFYDDMLDLAKQAASLDKAENAKALTTARRLLEGMKEVWRRMDKGPKPE